MAANPTLHDQALIALGNAALAAGLGERFAVKLICVRCGAAHWVPAAPLERLPVCCQRPRRRPPKATRS